MSTTGTGPEQPVDPEHEEHGFLEEEIVVPKGTSRRRFLFTLALTLFVLVIFTVGDLVQSTLGGGGGGDPVYMTWTDPDTGATEKIQGSAFLASKRKLDRLFRAGLYQPLNAAEGNRAKVTDEDVALFHVLDRMAQKNGIEVSVEEFVRNLRDGGWTGETSAALASRNRMSTQEFESELREGMRPAKLRFMLQSAVGMVADPELVVSSWQENNPQYTFEYVALNASDMEKQAMAATPDDEALEAWYNELPDWDKQKYYSDEKVLATVAYLPLEAGFDATVLFEAYPLPEDWDSEVQARSYYNRFIAARFQNPDADPEGEEKAEGEEPTPLYLEFEEVAERAAEEAKLNQALTQFLDDLRTREGDEWGDATGADLATEGEVLGLTVWKGEEPLARTAFETIEDWGGKQIATMLGFGTTESFLQRVVADGNNLIVGRVEEKTAREAPEFATIRDQIAARWVDDNAVDIAVEHLEALRDGFGARPAEEGEDTPWAPQAESEAFTAAVVALSAELGLESGLEAQTRGPLGRREYPDDDVVGASAADRYIVQTEGLYELEPGQVFSAGADPTRKTALLVRFVEQILPDPSTMKASELIQARGTLQRESVDSFNSEAMNPSSDWFKERYKIHLRAWDAEDDEGEESPAS